MKGTIDQGSLRGVQERVLAFFPDKQRTTLFHFRKDAFPGSREPGLLYLPESREIIRRHPPNRAQLRWGIGHIL